MRKVYVVAIAVGLLLCIAAAPAAVQMRDMLRDRDEVISFNVESFDRNRHEVVATGTVYVQQFFDLTDADVREIEIEEPEFFNGLPVYGWQRDGNRISRTFPVQDNITLRAQGEEIELRGERFALVAPKGMAAGARERLRRDRKVDVLVDGVAVAAAQVQVVDRSVAQRRSDEPAVFDIVLQANLRDAAPMCHLPQSGEGGRKVQANAQPMEGSCLDYNGWYTDGINWANYTWKGLRNFIGSDCDFAAGRGYCWSEPFTGKSCYSTHGGKICSVFIGHKSTYHRH